MVNLVLRSANWAQTTGVATIEGSRPPLVEKALQAVNRVGVKLGQYAYWPFLHSRGTIITEAEVTTGTVSVIQGSKTVTGTSTVWDSGMVGRTFHVSGYEELYSIGAVASATTLTLSTEFNGTTASARSYHIVQNKYPLPLDFDSEVAFLQFVSPGNIRVYNPEMFDERRFGPSLGTHVLNTTLPTGELTGVTIESDYQGRRVLVTDPFPRYRRQLWFTYYQEIQKFENDEDTWPFPTKLESVIEDGALEHIARTGKNEGQSAAMQMSLFFQGRDELAGVTRRADAFARFQPETGLRRMQEFRRRNTHRVRQGIEEERSI
jgi:hypothetical protein